MQTYACSIDKSAAIGDLATAMRYLWADVASRQGIIEQTNIGPFVRPDVFKRPSFGRPVLLKRTFNQSDFRGGFIRYWRVMSEWHPRYQSDLSELGLREAAII